MPWEFFVHCVVILGLWQWFSYLISISWIQHPPSPPIKHPTTPHPGPSFPQPCCCLGVVAVILLLGRSFLGSQNYDSNMTKTGGKKQRMSTIFRLFISIKKKCLNPWLGIKNLRWLLFKQLLHFLSITFLLIIFIFYFLKIRSYLEGYNSNKYTNYQKLELYIKMEIVVF